MATLMIAEGSEPCSAMFKRPKVCHGCLFLNENISADVKESDIKDFAYFTRLKINDLDSVSDWLCEVCRCLLAKCKSFLRQCQTSHHILYKTISRGISDFDEFKYLIAEERKYIVKTFNLSIIRSSYFNCKTLQSDILSNSKNQKIEFIIHEEERPLYPFQLMYPKLGKYQGNDSLLSLLHHPIMVLNPSNLAHGRVTQYSTSVETITDELFSYTAVGTSNVDNDNLKNEAPQPKAPEPVSDEPKPPEAEAPETKAAESKTFEPKTSKEETEIANTINVKVPDIVKVQTFKNGGFDPFMVSLKRLSRQELLQRREQNRESQNFFFAQYKCDLCVKIFDYESALINHKKKHKPSAGRYSCEICQIRFGNLPSCRAHIKIHSTEFVCILCGITYQCKRSMIAHLKYKHGSPPDSKICKHCSKSFRNRSFLHKHIQKEHAGISRNETETFSNEIQLCQNLILSTENTQNQDEIVTK